MGAKAPAPGKRKAVRFAVPGEEGECAFDVPRRGAAHGCAPPRVIQTIAAAAGVGEAGAGDLGALLRKTKEALACATSVCVVKSPAARAALGADVQARVLERWFRPAGPRETTEWLADNHITSVLTQWERRFPCFYAHSFEMLDFEARATPLASCSLPSVYEEGKRTFACILNLDRWSGTGTHWTALFADMRQLPWSVEYFNSTGNPPPREVLDWLRKAANQLDTAALAPTQRPPAKRVFYDVVHQQKNSECGPYALFYIWSRLNGVPVSRFQKNAPEARIRDEEMYKFRRFLFSAE